MLVAQDLLSKGLLYNAPDGAFEQAETRRQAEAMFEYWQNERFDEWVFNLQWINRIQWVEGAVKWIAYASWALLLGFAMLAALRLRDEVRNRDSSDDNNADAVLSRDASTLINGLVSIARVFGALFFLYVVSLGALNAAGVLPDFQSWLHIAIGEVSGFGTAAQFTIGAQKGIGRLLFHMTGPLVVLGIIIWKWHTSVSVHWSLRPGWRFLTAKCTIERAAPT